MLIDEKYLDGIILWFAFIGTTHVSEGPVIMQSTVTRPDGIATINNVLRLNALVLDAVLITPDADVNFRRDHATAAQQARGFTLIDRELGSNGVALPRTYTVENGISVRLCRGKGVTIGPENPNYSCIGLVQRAAQIGERLALGVTFSDAPGALLVHTQTGLLGATSGIAHQLGAGPVSQTLRLMRRQSLVHGVHFSESDVQILVTPGAREGYMVNDRMLDVKLADVDSEILESVTVLDYEPGAEQPHSLDLALLYKKLWIQAGVPEENIFFDDRNTLVDPDLPSKRAADKRGEPSYGSGILAGMVRPL